MEIEVWFLFLWQPCENSITMFLKISYIFVISLRIKMSTWANKRKHKGNTAIIQVDMLHIANKICCQTLCRYHRHPKFSSACSPVTIIGKLIINTIQVSPSHFADRCVWFNRYLVRIITINWKYRINHVYTDTMNYVWLFVTTDVSLYRLYFGNSNISSNSSLMQV